VASAPLNAFTVDVEDYFQVSALAPAVARDTWGSRELRVERNTERMLELLVERGVAGTFFVLGWVAERCPALVRRISAAGHEIACHGYSHELIYRQTRADFALETERSKKLLEDQTGAAVLGYRAASFSITRESLWALDVLIDQGFAYDSSIFPIRHDRYGIADAPVEPARVSAPSRRSIVEFPMSTAKLFGLRVPVSGGGYFRILPYGLTRRGLRSINAQGRPFTFYIHPWEIDPEQPRLRAGALSTFRHYTNLHACADRLRRLLAEFAFAPMRAVLAERGLLGARAPAAASAA
jgi:polysaccharide deacetylase family protein (PEP-CTERM system associated)